ncbi:MAG: BrnT family toxin [Xanthomonadaceae bacterium]|nr:BrnT family toxin [Xanthomonadaceae bacterium]
MDFEWNRAKAAANRRKHGVTFEEAATIFDDPLALTFADPDHAFGEEHWLTFGISNQQRLLTVAHTERHDRLRIISAREATRHEHKIYEEG